MSEQIFLWDFGAPKTGSHLEARFVDENSAKLIQWVTSVMPIADELHSKGMIHDEKYAEIKAEKTNQDKMRKFFESLTSGGDKVKKAFYYLLEKIEEHLFKDLGKRTLSFMKEIEYSTATGVIYDLYCA
uniref:Si:ch211-66k16.27 n=1 Tax=Sinocyclocheilus rhinocerous TaxID=307959 RepID=A0A673KP93_9TELE